MRCAKLHVDRSIGFGFVWVRKLRIPIGKRRRPHAKLQLDSRKWDLVKPTCKTATARPILMRFEINKPKIRLVQDPYKTEVAGLAEH